MEFKEKLINQTSEIAKNKPDFCPFGPKKFFVNFTSTRNCCKLSFYAISRKTNEPNWRKWQKKLVLGIILVYLAQIQATKFVSFFNFFFFFFFFKNLAPSVTKYHGHLSSCTISEKTNDPILRKLRDRQTNRLSNRPEWFHRTLSDNVEHPKIGKTKDRLLKNQDEKDRQTNGQELNYSILPKKKKKTEKKLW